MTVDENGNIQIKPVDGSAAGTYTVVIDIPGNGGTREYELVINVSEDGTATVVTAISHPAGTSMVLDLDKGALTVKETDDGKDNLTISTSKDGVWSLDPSIHSITVVDGDKKNISVTIDPVTGDVIAQGTTNAPYTIVIETDNRTITVTTDKDGKVIKIEESGKSMILDLDGGSVDASAITLDLTKSSGGSYSLADGVSIISVKAGNGAIDVSTGLVIVDKTTGDIYIKADGDRNIPAGPFEIKVSVDGETYVIKTDATGKVTSINPGSVVLELSNGKIMFNDIAKLEFATSGTFGGWSISSGITNLSATDETGKTVSLSVDSSTGNIVTASSFTDPVTIIFNRTDSDGNVIKYTIVVVNGSVSSYIAEITNPSSKFDFSTVTNVSISLKVVDGKSGLPVGQASISMLNGSTDSWKGFTDDSGLSLFSATVDSANKTTKVTVSKSGYQNAESPIDGIGTLIEFCKRIALTPVEKVTIVDTDGDGVADADDDFPNDPTLSKSITKSFTLAFEDNYAFGNKTFDTGNDADFNDVVVRLTLTEKIDSQNKVRKLDVTAKVLASYSGANSAFGIYINGIGRKILFEKARLEDVWFTQCTKFADVTEHYEFANGISRSDLGAMPYDPFLIPGNRPLYYNRSVKKYVYDEVHLASVNTTYGGVRSGSGTIATVAGNVSINNFVWALCLPDGWKWPYESTCIGIAYPNFVNWCNSAGTADTDWYNYPVSGKVAE